MSKEDKRIKKTRTLLEYSLGKLLLKKPYSKISVTDICEEVYIGRSTFYTYFSDKNQLLEYMLINYYRKLRQECLDLSFKAKLVIFLETLKDKQILLKNLLLELPLTKILEITKLDYNEDILD